MTVPNKPLLASFKLEKSPQLAGYTPLRDNKTPLRLFKRHRLAALITSTILLHACTTLPENVPEEVSTISQAELRKIAQTRANSIRQSRSIASPVSELGDINDGNDIPADEQTVWFRV